jgi:hypothetical protein
MRKKKYKEKILNNDIDIDILDDDIDDIDDDTEEDTEEDDTENDDCDLLDEDIEKLYNKPKIQKAKKEKFYVEPKKFDEEISNYYETGNMTDELADMVSKIAHKLSYASNFINYTYREDMVGDALIRMFKALISKKYDRIKGTNPFSYFTRIAFNAFRNRIKKEKHINETHLKYQEELIMMSENQNVFKNKKGLFTPNED